MRLPPLYGAAIFQDTCVALIKKVRVGGVETTYINRFTLLMWGHIKNRGKRKPCKSRLLKPYLFAHPNPINAIISWIIS